MENLRLVKAVPEDLQAVCDIVQERIDWMNEKGIRQWNVTDYWGRYPVSHYAGLIDKQEMYVLKDEKDYIIGTVTYFSVDDRWPEDIPGDAWYLHHLATRVAYRGAGEMILKMTEDLARSVGKEYLRLDCADDNTFLNGYYGRQGYELRGTCADGLYTGVCREKKL